MQRSQNDNESRIDWGIIFCVLLLALIGLASIYVAASNDKTPTSITRSGCSKDLSTGKMLRLDKENPFFF